MALLTVNAGSSSARLAAYPDDADGIRRISIYHGAVDADPRATLKAFSPATPIRAVAHRVGTFAPLHNSRGRPGSAPV